MKCAYCNCLDVGNKSSGCVSGCLYYCKLKKEYINANDEKCDDFEKCSKEEKIIEKMIDDGRGYDDIPFSASTLFVFSVILIIVGLIMGVF